MGAQDVVVGDWRLRKLLAAGGAAEKLIPGVMKSMCSFKCDGIWYLNTLD
jgi:hypothetical protein